MKNIIFNQKDNEIEVPELKTPEPDDNILRIDFLYYASPIYIIGGWVQIHHSNIIEYAASECGHLSMLTNCFFNALLK